LNLKQSRLDWYDDVLADESAQALFKPSYTEDGFLQVRAPLTNIGVFTYLTEAGTVHRELRTPEQVLDAASYKTLQGVPLTIDHPAEKVTPENAKALTVGNISGISADSYRVYADITITDKEAIEAVKNGKRALSCGYACDLEQKQGVWMGVEYDAIQTNIKYNHVALVDRGRAGDDARIRFDGFDAVLTKDLGKERRDHNPKKDEKMRKIRLDGVSGEFNADEEVIDYVAKLAKELEEAQAEVAKITKELETEVAKAKAEADAEKELKEQVAQELTELKEQLPAMVEAEVKEQTALIEVASKADVAIEAGMSAQAIKTAIVLKAFPKADVEALKQDAYLQARYDGAVELLAEKQEADKQAQVTEVGGQAVKQDSASDRIRNAYLNAWKAK
jgi:hypothetical protein